MKTDSENKTSGLRKLVDFFKRSTKSTADGIGRVYRAGNKNRHFVLPAVLGLFGGGSTDAVDKSLIKMSFRLDEKDVDVSELEIEKKLVDRGKHVVVFLHGLMTDESVWQFESDKFQGYGPKLERDLGTTNLFVRYNTGLHISDNGKSLTNLLAKFCETYGEKIDSLTLIGHSMGGLLIRSAGYYAQKEGHTWIEKLSAVFMLGSPSSGAMLEKFGHLTAAILRKVPNFQTRLVGKAIDYRSAGIKDLRLGLMVEEDWKHDRSDSVLFNLRTKVEPLPDTRYYVLAGTMAEDTSSLLALYFGDGMVSKRSATGITTFAGKDPLSENLIFKAFGKTNHLDLLFSDEVYEYLKSEIF